MNGRWFWVDGRLTQLHGSNDDIIDQRRALVADHHTVRDAKVPHNITSREIASRAASHRRSR